MGSATFTPESLTEAKGIGGAGGTIKINAKDVAAGVDRETAAALIQQFENEDLNIDTYVIEFLKSIQSETT